MKKMNIKSKQKKWQRKTLEYVSSVNLYVEEMQQEGWEYVGKHPEDTGRERLVGVVLDAVRQANTDGGLKGLRDAWPPAHLPFVNILEKNGQSIPVICLLPDNSIVLRVGAPYQSGKTMHIVGDTVTELPDVGFFGRSPNRKYFAIAQADGVQIIEGWNGPQTALCPWPSGLEGVPDSYPVKTLKLPPKPTRLIPFPDGLRVLLVSSVGTFVLSEEKVTRLLPTEEDIKRQIEWQQENDPEGDLSLGLDMEHGAISSDGKLIAVGSQDSAHLVFDQDGTLLAEVGNQSEYPHYALFSADDSMIAFNSCHFYGGMTVGVPTKLLPGLFTHPYEPDERTPLLEIGARNYAGTSRNDEFIVGDAHGYVRAFSTSGELRWELFIGSTIGDIDISADGKTLVVSTYAGFVSIIKMDAGGQASHQIGNSQHRETRRWIFWKNEPAPLIW